MFGKFSSHDNKLPNLLQCHLKIQLLVSLLAVPTVIKYPVMSGIGHAHVILSASLMVTAALIFLLYKRSVRVNGLSARIRFNFIVLESECQHGSVRLVGGLTDYAGRLEFCAHGRWGRVCNSLNFWGPDNSKVACRQLGYPEEGDKSVYSLHILYNLVRRCIHTGK